MDTNFLNWNGNPKYSPVIPHIATKRSVQNPRAKFRSKFTRGPGCPEHRQGSPPPPAPRPPENNSGYADERASPHSQLATPTPTATLHGGEYYIQRQQLMPHASSVDRLRRAWGEKKIQLFSARVFQIIVFERRHHAINFPFGDAIFRSFVSPRRYRLSYLCRYSSRLVFVQLEIVSYAHGQIE